MGISCYLIQLGLVQLLQDALSLYLANVLGFLASAQANFVLSQFFTWADHLHGESLVRRFMKFNANALVAATLVNGSALWLLAHSAMPLWVAILLANVLTACWTFLVNHYLVFKAEQAQRPRPIGGKHMSVSSRVDQQASVALFMPAFNESANLKDVIGRAHAFFDRMNIVERTIIVVDDGSTDDTATTLTAISGTYPVEIVTHAVNAGYGRALRSGFEAALATGHAWIAYCDSDGQFNPADLAMFLAAADSHGVDVVLGVRAKRADNLVRRAAGRGWHGVSRLVLKYRASDVDCGFKLLRRSAVAAIAADLKSDYAAISPELLARLARAGHAFVEIPVPHYPRANGKQSGLDPKVVMKSFSDLYSVRRELAADRAQVSAGVAPVQAPVQAWLPIAGQEAV